MEWTREQREQAAADALRRVWPNATPRMVAKQVEAMVKPDTIHSFRAQDVIILQCELTAAHAENERLRSQLAKDDTQMGELAGGGAEKLVPNYSTEEREFAARQLEAIGTRWRAPAYIEVAGGNDEDPMRCELTRMALDLQCALNRLKHPKLCWHAAECIHPCDGDECFLETIERPSGSSDEIREWAEAISGIHGAPPSGEQGAAECGDACPDNMGSVCRNPVGHIEAHSNWRGTEWTYERPAPVEVQSPKGEV